MIMKKKLLIAGLAIGLSVSPVLVQAADAPAGAPPKGDWMKYNTPYVGEENNPANPHRSAEEISIWAQKVVTDILSFSKANYKEKFVQFKKHFVPAGWNLYAAYLKNSKLLNRVIEEGFSVGTIATETPEIVQQGSASGAYHWIVRIPVTVGLFTVNPQGENVASATQKSILFIDIGRVEGTEDEDGIAIHNWRMDEVR